MSEKKQALEEVPVNMGGQGQARLDEMNCDPHSSSSSDSQPVETMDSSSRLLEWKFIDFSKADKCPIYEVDPVMLKRFVGQNVTVVNSSGEEFHGCCLAIDPVSLSVILAKRLADEEKIRVITLPGYYLSRIYASSKHITAEETISVNDLDLAELYCSGSNRDLFSGRKRQNDKGGTTEDCIPKNELADECLADKPSTSPIDALPVEEVELSGEELQIRKEALKSMLIKHRMPVTVKNDVLEIPGGVTISPPYTVDQVDTKGNQIIKKKLGELIKSVQKPSMQYSGK